MGDPIRPDGGEAARWRLDLPASHPPGELFDVVEVADRFFRKTLHDPEVGEPGLEHLRGVRGLPERAILEHGFGFMGEGWRSLVDHVAADPGVTLEQAADARLVDRNARAAADAFRARFGRPPASEVELAGFFRESLQNHPRYYLDYPRIALADGKRLPGLFLTIPVQVIDAESGEARVAGFQYRTVRPKEALSPRAPSYMSPRSSPLLVWKRNLMGLAESRPQMRVSREVILCEGKFDQVPVIEALRALPPERRPAVVALGGLSAGSSAAGEDGALASTLRALHENGVQRARLLLDEGSENEARAILTLGSALLASRIDVRVARIADAHREEEGGSPPKDPGELFVRSGGEERLREVLEHGCARTLGGFAGEWISSRLAQDSGSGGLWFRLRQLDRVSRVLHGLPEPARGDAVRHLADALGFSERAVALAIGDAPESTQRRIAPARR
jgi:hypothetical protein